MLPEVTGGRTKMPPHAEKHARQPVESLEIDEPTIAVEKTKFTHGHTQPFLCTGRLEARPLDTKEHIEGPAGGLNFPQDSRWPSQELTKVATVAQIAAPPPGDGEL